MSRQLREAIKEAAARKAYRWKIWEPHNGRDSFEKVGLQGGAGVRYTGCYFKSVGKESVTEQVDLIQD